MSPRRFSKAATKDLRKGHLVIATYPVDNKLYRAQIEKVTQASSCDCDLIFFLVRYIDYGNACEVGSGDLYIWDEILQIIPAMAVSCKLESRKIFISPLQVGSRESLELTKLLKKSNPISVKVRKVLRPRSSVFSQIIQKIPELVVDVSDFQDVNLIEKMRGCEHLGRLIRDNSDMKSSRAGSSVISKVASSAANLTPPKAEHLDGEECVDFNLEEAGITEAGFQRSLKKVQGWLLGLNGQEKKMLPFSNE